MASSLVLFSCNSSSEEKDINTTNSLEIEELPVEEIALDTAEIIASTDAKRLMIEGLEIEAMEVSTEGLRDKIKQKWSKIHFYANNGTLLKVKTYPYEGISKRTEEFYADIDGLILVVVEDNGDGPKGKSKDELDKMYYFNSGELLKELSKDSEEEYNIRNSDAEELLSEFKEYMVIYSEMNK